ncbi:50S ribosomal protein L29 [Candidatus Gottesmanbacteria bacterium]|nr:50S ribosomal protein L29 [Candidatus Gottesmanbacteria bacterium]
MKRKDFQNLRQKEEGELNTLLSSLDKEVVKLNLNIKMRKEKNTSAIESKKKDIARILTILKERQLKNGKIS